MLGAIEAAEIDLLVELFLARLDEAEAAEKFGILGPRQVIFTKLDEAVGFGVIVNVLHDLNLRLSYLTTGQSVPDDIEAASARRVAQLILGDEARSQNVETSERRNVEIPDPSSPRPQAPSLLPSLKPQPYEALA